MSARTWGFESPFGHHGDNAAESASFGAPIFSFRGVKKGLLQHFPKIRKSVTRAHSSLWAAQEPHGLPRRVVALDEFQYFTRDRISEFTSFIQREVDLLVSDAANCPGDFIVLGSIHAEIEALLDDKNAPLFHRTTDEMHLTHLDIASVMAILRAHSDASPERLLFLWSLFEGVPKFYRDCFEQGVLEADRKTLLRKMFFESSSPLRTEADNWFLKELRGRYDVVLKYVAKCPGKGHAEIQAHVRDTSRDEEEQVISRDGPHVDRVGS